MKKRILYLLLCVFACTSVSAQITSVALVGAGIEPDGWPGQVNNPGPVDKYQMTSTDGVNWKINNLTLVGGPVKFRANNAWGGAGFEWAAPSFPSGVGTSAGDIPTIAGTYNVNLNTTTGAYNFEGGAPYPIVKLVGTAVSNPDGFIMKTSDGNLYQLTGVQLLNGSLQFNIDTNLTVGNSTFPGGIANSDLSIPIISSNYVVDFNLSTGEYIFSIDDSGMIPKVKIVGSAVNPNEVIEMTTLDGENYSVFNTTLHTGNGQFDLDGSLYGGNDFPAGFANSNSIGIPIIAGEYSSITFNSITGVYIFKSKIIIPSISVTGSAVGSWGIDIDLTTTDGINYSINGIKLTNGELKFRQDYNYENSWGDPTSSTGSIFVTFGMYNINFNRITGIYNFTPINSINSVALVGAGIEPDGWPGQVNNPGPNDKYQMTTTDGINWTIENITLVGGPVKFRANNVWGGAGFEWASTAFPSGTGTSAGDIPAIAGTYTITLNTITGAYNFTGGGPKAIVKLVGTATEAEGTTMVTVDGTIYKVTSTFTEGTLQFDIDGATVGGSGYPSGSATSDKAFIPVPAGTYTIAFDLGTGFYVFKFPVISITGSAVGGWGVDTDLTTTDGDIYSINNLTVTDGEVRFRQDNNWLISWGDSTSSNGSIFVTAGTYDITFTPSGTYVFGRGIANGIWTFRDSLTKAVVFTNDPALSSKGFNSANFKVYPNPTQNFWNFTTASESIESVKIVDVLGKNVLTVSPKSNNVSVDGSSLTKGIYFAKIATAKATETIKLMKN